MPRRARLDFPGALHHVMARGIERREIFRDDADREAFVKRLEAVLDETKTPCYAWALVPNHFHLLLVSGAKPVRKAMQSLLVRYASYFNRRHRRAGHLFQNRYKSILCERDPYFRELVRYIHLNPLRARLVRDLRGLDAHPWTGHAVLMGRREAPWQDTETVLSLFGDRAAAARRAYREFVAEGRAQGRRPDLTGGGLVRSLGGWRAVEEARRRGERVPSDERILGGGEFVSEALKAAQETMDRRTAVRRAGWTPKSVIAQAAERAGADVRRLVAGRRSRAESRARGLAAYWLVEELGMKAVEVARLLGVSQPAVSQAVAQLREAGAVPALARAAESPTRFSEQAPGS